MRNHAKASSAGSTEGAGNGRGLLLRAFAIRGASSDSKGSGAPAGRRVPALIAVLALTIYAAALTAAPASAATPEMGTVTKAFSTTAQVTGTIGSVTGDPGGTTYWRFDISTDNGANWTAAEKTSADANPVAAGQEVQATLIDLTPATEYQVRFAVFDAVSEVETISAATPAFTTAPAITAAPTVLATGNAGEVSFTSAKASGEVQRPAGEDPALDAACQFEYITDAAYIANPVGERFSGATPVACNHNPVKAADGPAVEAALTGLAPATIYHLRLVASNAAGTDSKESASTFETETVIAPTVTLDPVTSFTATSAHLSGKVDPNGTDPAFAASWHFHCSPACGEPGGTVAAGPEGTVQADLSGLEPNTEYLVELLASNLGGPGNIPTASFKTPTLPPFVHTGFATDVEGTSATLNGTINPHNSAVTYQFEYGPTEGYGSKAPASPASLGALDNSNHEVSQAISGLTTGVEYHFRLVATNTESEETVQGADHTFRAGGAASCENEQLRAENNSLALPDCRAYELVSPVKKNGFDAGAPNGGWRYAHAAADGNGIFYATRGPQGTTRRGLQEYSVSRRGEGGWNTRSALPAGTRARLSLLGHEPKAVLPSADLSKLLFASPGTYNPPANPETDFSSALYMGDEDGSIAWLSEPQIENSEPPPGSIGGAQFFQPVGASPDLSTVYFWSPVTLLPSDDVRAGTGTWGLYEYADGELKPADTLPPTAGHPDGEVPVGGAAPAATGGYFRGDHDFTTPEEFANQVSRDGSTLLFVSPDPGIVPSVGPTTQLYMRRAGTSKLISHAEDGAPAPHGVTPVTSFAGTGTNTLNAHQFAFGSPDGNSVVFQSIDPLTALAPNDSSPKTYRYDAATEEVTYLPGLAGQTPVAASEDGSIVLFGTTSDGGAISLWDDGVLRTLAAGGGVTQLAPARATPTGSVFVFSTDAQIPGFNSGGFVQVYRYETAQERITCVSCLPDPGTPSGPAILAFETNEGGTANTGELLATRGISENGNRVFFTSPDELVPADTDDYQVEEEGTTRTVHVDDVYEWTPSGISLVSTGRSTSNSILLDIGAKGDDVFFATSDSLDPRDSDGAYDVYDARVDGGFAQTAAVVPCTENATCKDAGATAPTEAGPATTSFSGPGNPEPCPKGKVRKHGSCVKQKPKKHKHHGKAHKKHHAKKASHKRGGGK